MKINNFNHKQSMTKTTPNPQRENQLGGIILALIAVTLFGFNFWLFYPGVYTYDWTLVMFSFRLNNWQPVIYPLLLQKITNLFGYHLYYPLLFNLIPFYLGVYTLAYAIWKKFNSCWCLLGFLPLCIGNIFCYNIFAHCSAHSPMFIFLLWSVMLYQLLVGITYKNTFVFMLTFLLALLSRHNAIIQVFPVFFVYGWLIVQKKAPSYRLLKYMGLLTLFAILTIGIAIGIPRAIVKGETFSSNPDQIFLHQMAGVCLPHHDATCFSKEWYKPGKTFKDLKKAYFSASPTNTDNLSIWRSKKNPFRSPLSGLSSAWLHAITKYPWNYIIYCRNFIKEQWFVEAIEEHTKLKEGIQIEKTYYKGLKTKYPKDELLNIPSSTRVRIYNLLRNRFPIIPTIGFIVFNFISFPIIFFLFLKKKDALLLYALSSNIAGIAGAFIFTFFSPSVHPRYMYPILISSLMSLIGFVVYLYKVYRPCQNITKKEIKKQLK